MTKVMVTHLKPISLSKVWRVDNVSNKLIEMCQSGTKPSHYCAIANNLCATSTFLIIIKGKVILLLHYRSYCLTPHGEVSLNN